MGFLEWIYSLHSSNDWFTYGFPMISGEIEVN